MPYTIILTDGTQLEEQPGKFNFKRKDMALFMLTLNNKTIAVDLKTGIFYINGIALDPDYAHEGHEYRLIYFKRHNFSIGAKPVPDHIALYMLGWQITKDGENHQRIMFWNQKDNTIRIKRRR